MIYIIYYFFIKGTEVNVLFCPLSRPPNRGEKSGCESPSPVAVALSSVAEVATMGHLMELDPTWVVVHLA